MSPTLGQPLCDHPPTLPAGRCRTDRDAYLQDGLALIREGLPATLITDIRGHLDGLLATLTPGQRPEDLIEPHARTADWRFWLELCRHPVVLAAVARAMGASELLLIMSHLIVKPAHDGKAVAWHQDITYWPSIQGSEVGTVWLAIDDVDTGNGCMQVIPRTHAERERMERIATDGRDLLKVRVSVTAEQERLAVPCALPAGHFTIHDAFAIHGSAANRSARRRAGYTMRYADAGSVQVDLAKHWVPVYYVLGDGTRCRPGMRDLRAGLSLPETPR